MKWTKTKVEDQTEVEAATHKKTFVQFWRSRIVFQGQPKTIRQKRNNKNTNCCFNGLVKEALQPDKFFGDFKNFKCIFCVSGEDF